MKSLGSRIWRKGQKAVLPTTQKEKPKYISTHKGTATYSVRLSWWAVIAIQEEFPNLSISKAVSTIVESRYPKGDKE